MVRTPKPRRRFHNILLDNVRRDEPSSEGNTSRSFCPRIVEGALANHVSAETSPAHVWCFQTPEET
jgi:hypothetical protein